MFRLLGKSQLKRRVLLAALTLSCVNASGQTTRKSDVTFNGRKVIVTEGEHDPEDMLFPKGPASVCLQGPPELQCYTAPKEFGNSPSVTLIQLAKDTPALLFSAASGGVSGWGIHFAVLQPGTGKALRDLFYSDISLSNQGRKAFWSIPEISDVPVFVTADYVSGPDEGHYDEHRYIVSAYMLLGNYYCLEDRYMTVGKYDSEEDVDILAAEKPEILTRLRRLKNDGKQGPHGH